ncbi:MAG: hypothetical protein ABSH22_02075, partial [Tepidisphaeraceae bacterium]
MKRQFLLAVALTFAISGIAKSDPKDDVLAAIKKLEASPNYSWATTVNNVVEDGRDYGGGGGNYGGGPVDGKTEKDGFTTFELAWPNDIYDLIVTRSHDVLIKTREGWKWNFEVVPAGMAGAGGRGPLTPEEFILKNFDFRTPSELARYLVTYIPNMQQINGDDSGDLANDSVKSLLTFRANRGTDQVTTKIRDTAGSAVFSFKDGVLSTLEYQVNGTMDFEGIHQINRR